MWLVRETRKQQCTLLAVLLGTILVTLMCIGDRLFGDIVLYNPNICVGASADLPDLESCVDDDDCGSSLGHCGGAVDEVVTAAACQSDPGGSLDECDPSDPLNDGTVPGTIEVRTYDTNCEGDGGICNCSKTYTGMRIVNTQVCL